MPGMDYGPVKPTPIKRLGVKPVQQGGATGMSALKMPSANITLAPGSRGGKLAAPKKPKMPTTGSRLTGDLGKLAKTGKIKKLKGGL